MILVGPIASVSPGLPGGVSAALDITEATVLKPEPGILCTISVLAAGTSGTLTVNDAASTGGAQTANAIYSCAYDELPADGVIPLNWPCSTGITVSSVPSGAQVAVSYS